MNKEFIKWYNARGKRNSPITMGFMEEAFNAGMQTSNQRCTQDASKQAKADAEVMRCAEKLYQEYFYGNDDEKAMRHNRVLVRGIHNAVRAAKEASSGRS